MHRTMPWQLLILCANLPRGALSVTGSFPAFTWHSEAPTDIPFKRSDLFTEVEFAGRYAAYAKADTWYPSWAADGKLYSPFADGTVNGVTSYSSCGEPKCLSTSGFAVVEGDDPLNLTITRAGSHAAAASPYNGRYPSASLYYKGTWFYGTYLLDNENRRPGLSVQRDYCGSWCIQGPFAGFRWSLDQGRTWQEPRVHLSNYSDNLFGESAPNNHSSKVKFGAPHVVDLGRELEHTPAGDERSMMYIVGHGASEPYSPTSWMQGSAVYMARVEPTVEAVQDRSKWEFYAGGGKWAQGDPKQARPLLSWANRTGVTTMTYVPAIKRYLVCISTPTFSPMTREQFDTYILEGEAITGPFKYITYMRMFGPQGYFVNIPSKFLAPTVSADGSLRLFLSYSANYAFPKASNPPGSAYHWMLQEVLLKRPGELVV